MAACMRVMGRAERVFMLEHGAKKQAQQVLKLTQYRGSDTNETWVGSCPRRKRLRC